MSAAAASGYWVYRLFDAQDRLLFVGCPESRTRLQAHLCRKDWLPQIARAQVQEFSTLSAALAEEAAALVSEAPRYNHREDLQ